MKGRPQSREHAEKSAKSRTGLKRSQEAIEKQRLRAGKHLLGKKQSPEHVAKSAAARKGLKRSPEAVARTAAAHTGMKRSSETCDLLSQVMMRRMEDGTYVNPYTRTIKGVFLDRLGREQRYDSSWELTRMRELDALELSWDKHHPIWILYVDSTGKQRRYKPDFVVKDPATGETWIEEVKGYETKLDLCKYEAAIPFCAVRGWAFRVLAHAHFVRPKASMLGQTAL